MANVVRIRDLSQETTISDTLLIPVDKSTYGVAAKYAAMSDIAAYVAGGAAAYINTEAVPSTIGGIESGTTFASPGYSMQEMWDMLLYPYQYPAFITFSIQSESTTQEIGDGWAIGYKNFLWTTSNSTNVSGNTIEISGYKMVTMSNLNNDGIQSYYFTVPVTGTTDGNPGTTTWYIDGENTNGSSMTQDSFSIRWDWKWYYGTSTNTGLTEAQIEALTSSGLYSSYSRTFSFGAGGYKFLCFADTYGGPSNFVDSDTGFGIAMYGGYVQSENGYSYDLITVTNSYGKTTDYRVYRTQNIITDAINITVS